MWTQASSLMLLLACCLWSTEAQRDGSRRQSIWDEPIKFNTKADDLCAMVIAGHGELTRLRLKCQASKSSYWCEYEGKPYTCRSYNKNPRHFFVQMMWDFRKLHNACQGPRQIKPHMCRKASDAAQMVFLSSSFTQSWSDDSSRTARRPTLQPARPQLTHEPTRPDTMRQVSTKSFKLPPRVNTTQETTTKPQTPPLESHAKRMARQHCWESLQGLCSFFIGLFQNE
ncbi:fibroblast growth factor binding protein 2a [Echeneis naucrates]|nr:fibroblast growth factor-binding protein 2-like [Echeneis naucrates]